jgi:hypothetical protein
MRARSALLALLLTLFGLALAACGQPAAVVAPSPVPTQPQPAAATPAASTLARIAQGRTAEGYQALGAADAPVTMVMYSDFL